MRKIVLVIILSLAVAACQKASNIVIDTSLPINVQLTYFDKDSVDIASYLGTNPTPATISDGFQVALSGQANFKYLEVQVSNDSGNILNDVLFSTSHGNTVSGKVATTITNVYVGNISYTFTAYNEGGASGDYAIKNVKLFNSRAEAPVIDSISAPDSLMLSPTDTVTAVLTAFVHDPSGLSNIAAVYFNVTKPNGQPSTGNPFRMYDDGGASHEPGDVDPTANDGHYTLGISLPPGTSTGTYTFTFSAYDRSGLESSLVSHKIVVYQ